ncbi:NDP-hexose 2,3-dehydratase family protein [Streptomyces sp. NPDC026672]|uniref:NDP-hexose 2,3-dehydratase family protein n=1 Tax=unclassified Streptomyces TaxID=2593676 RepID=UPI0033DDC8FF
MTATNPVLSSSTADPPLLARLAASAAAVEGGVMTNQEVFAWLADRQREQQQRVERVPFAALRGWRFDDRTGDLRHDSGRFFSVRGLSVQSDFGPVGSWQQPIIQQPEIGILGIAIRDFDGVPHLLMQAKSEPGNVNGVQLSPTVQATKSNYTRVHGGSAVPYLDLFRRPGPGRVVADVLQSEQGSWFLHKRNRNMVVEAGPEAEAGEDFAWLTLGQVNLLLQHDNTVNMDARTVLSCLPDWRAAAGGPEAAGRSLHPYREVRTWLTKRRAEHEVTVDVVPLDETKGWLRTPDAVTHESGRYFDIVAVDVSSHGREVPAWSQPLLEQRGTGVAALFVKQVDGVPHVLLRARAEPGFLDVVELGPTVQCVPENYEHLSEEQQPPYFAEALRRRAGARYDVVLSEEGGRFRNAQSHYMIIDVESEFPAVSDEFRWLTPRQVEELLCYSHQLNVQARTLVTALRSL